MQEVALFFFDASTESRKALHELLKAKVPCNLGGPLSEERLPVLFYKGMEFHGLDGIRAFIKRYSSEKKRHMLIFFLHHRIKNHLRKFKELVQKVSIK